MGKRYIREDLKVNRDLEVGRDLSLAIGPKVDEIETTLTDDDTHLPTSGAVLGAITGGGGTITYSNAIPMPEELG